MTYDTFGEYDEVDGEVPAEWAGWGDVARSGNGPRGPTTSDPSLPGTEAGADPGRKRWRRIAMLSAAAALALAVLALEALRGGRRPTPPARFPVVFGTDALAVELNRALERIESLERALLSTAAELSGVRTDVDSLARRTDAAEMAAAAERAGVTSDRIPDGAILARHLAAGAVGSDQIADGCVSSSKFESATARRIAPFARGTVYSNGSLAANGFGVSHVERFGSHGHTVHFSEAAPDREYVVVTGPTGKMQAVEIGLKFREYVEFAETTFGRGFDFVVYA